MRFFQDVLTCGLSSLLFVCVLVAFSPTNVLAQKPDPIESPDLSTKKAFVEFYKKSISADVFRLFYRLTPVKPVPFTSEAEFLETAYNDPNSLATREPWTFTLYPDVRIRLLGYDRMMNNPNVGFRVKPLLEGQEKRRRYLLDEKRPPGEGILGLIQPVPEPDISTYAGYGRSSDLFESSAIKMAACLRIDPLHAQSCKKALDRILQFMAPKDGVAALPLLQKVVSDENYARGTVNAALKIMDRVSEFKETGTIPNSSAGLFEDIVTSFLESGSLREEAINKTWDILGLFATRGANISVIFTYAGTTAAQRTLLALETIATGASVLDSAVSGSGHLYSLPKSIVTHADYGKVYHFWMTAYLSRMGALEGLGRGASSAAILTEIAYQMLAGTARRENFFDQLLSESLPGPATRKAQIDIAFGLAGAEHGLRADTIIDVDYAVARMVEGGAPGYIANAEKAVGKKISPVKFLAWLDQVHPFTGLNAIRANSCGLFLKKHTDPVSYVASLGE